VDEVVAVRADDDAVPVGAEDVPATDAVRDGRTTTGVAGVDRSHQTVAGGRRYAVGAEAVAGGFVAPGGAEHRRDGKESNPFHGSRRVWGRGYERVAPTRSNGRPPIRIGAGPLAS